jgi:hypothetical protein
MGPKGGAGGDYDHFGVNVFLGRIERRVEESSRGRSL